MKNMITKYIRVAIMIVLVVVFTEFLSSAYLEEFLSSQFNLLGTTLEFVDIITEVIIISLLLYFFVFRRELQGAEAILVSNKEKEQYFKFFMLSINPMGIADPFGNFKQVNTAFLKLTGYTEKELISKPFLDFVIPEDRERTASEMKRQVEMGSSLNFQNHYLCKDGRIILLSWTAFFDKKDGITYATADDITEQDRTRNQLATNQAHLHTLVQTIPDLIWLKDTNGIYLSCNTMFERFFGAKETDIIGKTDYDFVSKEQADFFRANDMLAMNAGGPSVNEEWITFADDGHRALIETTKTPMLNVEGSIIGVLGIGHDITERKSAESKIERLSKLYATLSLCNQAIVHSNNKEELFMRVCRAAVDSGGFKMAWIGLVDSENKKIIPAYSYGDTTEYLKDIHVSTEENTLYGIGPTGTSVREGKPYWCQDFEHDPNTEAWRKAGMRAGWKSSAALPLYQKENVVGALTLYTGVIGGFDDESQGLLLEMASDVGYALDNFVDKAAKKEVEDDLAEGKAQDEAIMASLGEGMIAVDKSGRIITMNRAAEKITGWSEEEIINKKLYDVIDAVDENGMLVSPDIRPISITLKTLAPATSDTLYFVQKNKGVIPVTVTATPVFLNNELTGAVIIFRDITKEKEIERTREDLLALASHQLRTPLSGTKWLIETLRKGIHGTLTENQKEYLDEIYKINERMTSLVGDMLGVLRMEGGSIPTNKTKVQTSVVLDTLLEAFSPATKEKRLELHIEKSGDYTVETDPLLLRNIIESFVSNAINYSNEGGKIVISLKEGANELVFAVKDSGIGIPKEEQGPQLFERFYRASNAKTFNTKGTGLGLYIASMLAKKIGASITFESEENKGSTFYVHLPFSPLEPLPSVPMGVY